MKTQRLTQTQLNHATCRLAEIAHTKAQTAIQALGPRPKNTELPKKTKLEMITKGTAKLTRPGHYGYIYEAFDYPLTPAQKKAAAAAKLWDTKANAINASIKKKQQTVIDQLVMSGDGGNALRALEAFANSSI